MTALAQPLPTEAPPRRADVLGPTARIALVLGAAAVTMPTLWALARLLGGQAPGAAQLKEVALAIHLATVIPAVPLGAWVLAGRKGGPRHRLLGKIWLALMVTTALAAFWIRHLNNGGLSFIHLFVPLVLAGSWRVIDAARRGDIRKHRRVAVSLFTGGMLAAGLTAFMPGRLLWIGVLG